MKLKLEQLKQIELDELIWFDEICKKQGFKYVLGFGTLLGAIRHKGFIPWDDDIDILMPRDDYNRMLKYLNENYSVRYRVLSCDYNKDYYIEFAKLVDKTTTLIQHGFKPINGLGVYIDIFPLDLVPSKNIINWFIIQLVNLRIITTNLKPELNLSKKSHIKLFKILGRIFRIAGFSNLAPFSTKIMNKINQKGGEYYSILCNGMSQNKLFYPKNIFTKRILWEFEGFKFYVPQDYDTLLKRTYGDYMKLPEESERIAHHNFDAYNN